MKIMNQAGAKLVQIGKHRAFENFQAVAEPAEMPPAWHRNSQPGWIRQFIEAELVDLVLPS